jgi:GH24 family phage-related lysozyme (muramidase)
MRAWHIESLVLIISAVTVIGCAHIEPTSLAQEENTLTPGIFLEDGERPVLPPGVELRKVSERGLVLTKVSEGFRSRLYHDAAGYCTIAYGHLVKRARCDGSEPAEFRRGVSEPRGTGILAKDMETAELVVMTAVDVELSDGQHGALCDFVFNVGGSNFRNSTLLKAINAGELDRVPSQFRRWIFAGGQEWPGLKVRREREIDLFFDGSPPRVVPRIGEDLTPVDIRTGETIARQSSR